VSGRMGDEFAAVLYEGDDLSDLDRRRSEGSGRSSPATTTR
jgi:hypothetical protein